MMDVWKPTESPRAIWKRDVSNALFVAKSGLYTCMKGLQAIWFAVTSIMIGTWKLLKTRNIKD